MHGPALYLALGYGSLYNHHDNPNANVKLDYTKGIITIAAQQEIDSGNEIFVSYGAKYFSSEKRKAYQSDVTKEGSHEQEGTKHT